MERFRTVTIRSIAVTTVCAVGLTLATPPVAASAGPLGPLGPPIAERVDNIRVDLRAAARSTAPLAATSGLIQQIGKGIVPSLGAPVPTPPNPGPVPTPANANAAVKNIYNAVEPWVQYGFELATYAVGWVPYVGWLAPQIMIFYNFGERIVRSITFNVDDWLLGPLPFVQGLGNVVQDSVDALVQLGIDQWNFWLPPLPPLPPLPLTADVAANDKPVVAAPDEALDDTTTDITSPDTSPDTSIDEPGTGRHSAKAVPPRVARHPRTEAPAAQSGSATEAAESPQRAVKPAKTAPSGHDHADGVKQTKGRTKGPRAGDRA
jgi:hypothetical protein